MSGSHPPHSGAGLQPTGSFTDLAARSKRLSQQKFSECSKIGACGTPDGLAPHRAVCPEGFR
ncbi:hypothetical protein, partial [Tritonibacter mobilis]|uniref:hypothetical protein n=1 Tax=Tritonibacter mobilis TaxID=379347 RepID=UPI00195094AA